MNKIIILALLTLTIYSCTTATIRSEKKSKIIITADSCVRWGLPPVNFEIEYPYDFEYELNPTGGFYLQLRKLKGDTILQELSFGRVEGPIDDEKIKMNFSYIDSTLNKVFNDHGQDYKTDFIGIGKFNGTNSPQIRSTLDLVNVTRYKFIAHGEYKSLITCVYSPTSSNQAMMISIISSTEEDMDNESKIGANAIEILKSLKMK